MPQFNHASRVDWRCRTCHTFDTHHTVFLCAICASSRRAPRCPPQLRHTAAQNVCACPTLPNPSTPTSFSHSCAGYNVNTFAVPNTTGASCTAHPASLVSQTSCLPMPPPGAPPSRWPRALRAPSHARVDAATKNGRDSPAPGHLNQAKLCLAAALSSATPNDHSHIVVTSASGPVSEKPCRLTHRVQRLVILHAAPRNHHLQCTSEQKKTI